MSQKEAQTTRTLFMVCLCFVVFVMPMETYDILFYLDLLPHGGNSYVYLPLHLLYWFQYSANFFIYAARSDQFRKAYLFFFSSVRTKKTLSCSPHTNNQYESRIFATNFCLLTLLVNIGKIKVLN